MQRDVESVGQMLECTQAISSYVKGHRRNIAKDGLLRDAILRRFEVMGAAATRISPELRLAQPEVPWKRIIAFRDLLIHGYDRIGAEQILAAVDALPEVTKQLKGLAAQT